MSREERRQYQRMTKGADRTPGLPPAARARAERARVKREAARGTRGTRSQGLSARYWLTSLVVASVAGLIGFSLQWPAMPLAAYVGIAVGVVTAAVLLGFRLLQRRAAPG